MLMTSNQPYMLRAFYEWIVDNNLTPYIVVDANIPGVIVPHEHVNNGQIVLNISPSACGKLQLGNVDVTFEARFSGSARQLIVPCQAIQAIYARENGAGTVFTSEDFAESEIPAETQSPEPEENPAKASKKPTLTIVK